MEDQRKKRRGADQDDGPDDDEVNGLVITIIYLNFEIGAHQRVFDEAVRFVGKCKARHEERRSQKSLRVLHQVESKAT